MPTCRRGTLGFKLKSSTGARVLYFLDDIEPSAVIKTPLILESSVLEWEESENKGVTTKELRSDPGTGARSWLVKIEPGAEIPWQSSSASREGYFLAGHYTHAECVGGEPSSRYIWPRGLRLSSGKFHQRWPGVGGGLDVRLVLPRAVGLDRDDARRMRRGCYGNGLLAG